MPAFSNRTEAGRALARLLSGRNYPDPVVLALPRGGVPVAIEIARALKAPLDLVMVRKLGVPFQPELAVGAVVNGDHPQIVVNDEVARQAGVSRQDLDRMAERQLEEIARRRTLYFKARSQQTVEGRTVIIVDDGIATGATTKAAIKGVRQRKPAKLVLAVPVAPKDTLEHLHAEVDDIICIETPSPFYAIGVHYADFDQVDDEEVVRLLDEAEHFPTGGG